MPEFEEVVSFWSADSDSRRAYAHYHDHLPQGQWHRHGENAIAMIRKQWPAFPESKGLHVLDFGCGGGSVTRALLDAGCYVLAADISDDALNETMNRCDGVKPYSVDTLHVPENPEWIADCIHGFDRHVDMIVSTAVFQHFPSQQYAADILDAFAHVAWKKTRAMIQIRHDDGNPKFASKSGPYASEVITYTSHTIDDFSSCAKAAGWRVARVEFGGGPNYAWYYLE